MLAPVRWWRVLGPVAVALAVTGCGAGAYRAYEEFRGAEDPPPAPAPSLCGDELALPKLFLGISAGELQPQLSPPLRPGTVYDFNVTYDLARYVSVECLIGYWNLNDGLDSSLRMNPLLLSLQLVIPAVPTARGRLYIAGGGGYFYNDYLLGEQDLQNAKEKHNVANFTYSVATASVRHAAIGFEGYSAADANVNLGIEVRYLSGRKAFQTVLGDGEPIPTYPGELPLNLWLYRVNLTWHF